VFRILLLLALTTLRPGGSVAGLPYPHHGSARPQAPNGSGPFLAPLPDPAATPRGKAAPGETWVDLPCDVFLPGKADPSQWMATATVAKVTYDGFTYQYGYDPLAQSYDLLVSGYATTDGILAQETVGVLAATLPAPLRADNILRVELWFLVVESNLFPNEYVGITDLTTAPEPSSSLDLVGMQRLYDDARGFSGDVYFLDHLAPGAYALDLGPAAVEDLAGRVDSEGWFGVGLAADGWDLSGSLGEMVFWKMAGGGGLPESSRPFFRVTYNAPPRPFDLVSPGPDAVVGHPRPTFAWDEAVDPNGDTPLRYTLRLGGDPQLTSAFTLEAGAATSVQPPFDLPPGEYWWEVVATDPGDQARTSERGHFVRSTSTDTPASAPDPSPLRAAPNPFNPRTTLSFTLPRAGAVRLWVADARGRRVATLREGILPAGDHAVTWDGANCASGVYHAVLEAAGIRSTTALGLVK